MPKFDQQTIAAIKNSVDLLALASKHTTLKRSGGEYLGICPMPIHPDKSPSFYVNPAKRVFQCFGCGAKGDAVEFVKQMHGFNFPEAVKYLAPLAGVSISENNPTTLPPLTPLPLPAPTPDWEPIFPIPPDAQKPQFNHRQMGQPVYIWQYLNEVRQLIGFNLRFDTPTGKVFLPLNYGRFQGRTPGWRYKGFQKPLPLYGLELLASYPEKNLVLVEGEKTADAARKLFPSHVVMSWQGGTGTVNHTDLNPLRDRDALLISDNDQVGRECMQRLAERLETICGTIRLVLSDHQKLKPGWDLADSKMSPQQAKRWVLNSMKIWRKNHDH